MVTTLRPGGIFAGLVVLFTALLPTQGLAQCASDKPSLLGAFPKGWGIDPTGSRFVNPQHTQINAGNVGQLQLKWVYGFASDTQRSFPLVTEDTVFIGDAGLGLVALDRANGCERWRNTDVGADVASAVLARETDDALMLVIASREGGISAVDALSGRTLWEAEVEDEPVPWYSGSPLVVGDQIFVPISSQEIALSMNPFYGCCKSSGGMAALDADTGEQLWYAPTIKEEPKVTGRHLVFVEKWGPSGAPVWSAPSFDAARGLLFFGTGENYTAPATETSDAIIALDAGTGERRWVRQFTANDTFNMGCVIGGPNCPADAGPDLDFGAPPIIATTPSGRDLVFAGQKSGAVYAMDPDTGDLVWSARPGRGGYLGGIHWGMAADAKRGILYVPISDLPAGPYPENIPGAPGMFALDMEDGTILWHTPRPVFDGQFFWPGLSAGIVAAEGMVLAGGLDGMILAYRATDGEVIWSFDSARTFGSVNGVKAQGASIDSHGPLIAGDAVIVSSGYGGLQMKGGNALLYFELASNPVPADAPANAGAAVTAAGQ